MRGRAIMRALESSTLMMLVIKIVPRHPFECAYGLKAMLRGNAADGDGPGCGRTL